MLSTGSSHASTSERASRRILLRLYLAALDYDVRPPLIEWVPHRSVMIILGVV